MENLQLNSLEIVATDQVVKAGEGSVITITDSITAPEVGDERAVVEL